jgi:glycine hydroxymethyltransferase
VAKDVGAGSWSTSPTTPGLVAGEYPNPVPHADVVTSTTHKSPRGRAASSDERRGDARRSTAPSFPAAGGPLMVVIAAKAVAFKRSAGPEFKPISSGRGERDRPRRTLTERGLRIVSGRTRAT